VTFKDAVYFFTGRFSRCIANGAHTRQAEGLLPNYHSIWLGRFDGVTWDPFYVDLEIAHTGNFFELAQPNWLYSNGDILIASVSAGLTESLYFWRDVDALGPEPFGNVENLAEVESDPPTAGAFLLPMGSKSVYYAIPDEVD
jgi:hypothetical protein